MEVKDVPQRPTSAAQTAPAKMPEVPLTLEGAPTLHQMFRMDWPAWKRLSAEDRAFLSGEFQALVEHWNEGGKQRSGVFSMIGHKADLMFVHFRDSFEELNRVETMLAKSGLGEFLDATTSYLSVVELGLYESTGKTYRALVEQGHQPFSEGWTTGVEETLQRQRTAMAPRLTGEIPARKYVCFYPMDRKRGEAKNWYMLPLAERARMMHEHGMVGRRYADVVKQIITGSIGFDDWEWGVDLFADDALVFKKLIYEMRFDQVSADYAEFGTFYVGVRLESAQIPDYLLESV
jgi:hydrogen peroxide-dependent heme synthase